uniref:TSA: Wollemia nobilis Ref_Wollemi_Transcript_1935_1396 transcribed RNA sequence n=1 Tax=Wollemia nobilis TaxID=56998 RepID=A0A0C9QX51_9CONI
MPKMCGERFESPFRNLGQKRGFSIRHLQPESTGSSSSSMPMSGYGNSNNDNNNGVQGGLPQFSPWSVVPSTVQWTNPQGLDHRLLSCMAAPSNEAAPSSSSSSSFSGFHCGPLQFPYERLQQSGAGGVYGRKSGVALNEHQHHHLQQHRQLMSNGPAGLLMDGLPGEMVNVGKMTPQEIIDAKALAASKSHSEAERRRRERINTHLATLRSLLPSTTKTDKASLLAEVIDHVKDLKRQAAEIAEGSAVPTETDELTVDSDPSCGDGKTLIKASVCCDDRPDLLSDLIKALRTLNLRTLKAEITTLGGRVKNVLVVDAAAAAAAASASSADDNNTSPPSINCIHEALKAVMERPNSEESPAGNKRQRLNSFNPIHVLDHRSI